MGRPKTGRFTVAKSITLNLSTATFLEEQCIKNNTKLSPYINNLVEQERQRIDKKTKGNYFFCHVCDKNRVIKVQGFGKPKFYCSECETNLTVEINKTLQ